MPESSKPVVTWDNGTVCISAGDCWLNISPHGATERPIARLRGECQLAEVRRTVRSCIEALQAGRHESRTMATREGLLRIATGDAGGLICSGRHGGYSITTELAEDLAGWLEYLASGETPMSFAGRDGFVQLGGDAGGIVLGLPRGESIPASASLGRMAALRFSQGLHRAAGARLDETLNRTKAGVFTAQGRYALHIEPIGALWCRLRYATASRVRAEAWLTRSMTAALAASIESLAGGAP